MGEQYLNSKCKFQCPYSASLMLTPQNIPPVAVKNTRGEMLTTGTKLSESSQSLCVCAESCLE